jgi:hypothetical protein
MFASFADDGAAAAVEPAQTGGAKPAIPPIWSCPGLAKALAALDDEMTRA